MATFPHTLPHSLMCFFFFFLLRFSTSPAAPDAVIVGQGIAHDLEWLGLEEGVDFGSASDLIELFAVRPTAAAPYLKVA